MNERAHVISQPDGGPPSTRGEAAERLVVERLRAALPPGVAVLPHVRWLLRDRGYVREGEADVVIGDPDRGILVIEVKAGEVSRDGAGTWWVGHNSLPRTPFEQATDSRHALVRKLSERSARVSSYCSGVQTGV